MQIISGRCYPRQLYDLRHSCSSSVRDSLDDEVLCKRYKFVPKSLLESQVEKDVPRGRSSARRGHCRGGFCRGGLGDIEVLGLTEDAVQIFWNNPDSVVTPGWEYGVI